MPKTAAQRRKEDIHFKKVMLKVTLDRSPSLPKRFTIDFGKPHQFIFKLKDTETGRVAKVPMGGLGEVLNVLDQLFGTRSKNGA